MKKDMINKTSLNVQLNHIADDLDFSNEQRKKFIKTVNDYISVQIEEEVNWDMVYGYIDGLLTQF